MIRQTDTTGVNHFDLRRAWDGTVIFRAFAPEDEEEDQDEETGEEDSGEDTGDGDGSSGTDADDSKEKVRNPEAKDRSNEAAKYRRRLRETEAEKAELERKVREFEDKGKDRIEVLERDVKEKDETISKLTDRASKAERQLAFVTSGAANLVSDPELALMLLDLKDLEPDDEGHFDAKEIISRTEALIKSKPVLQRNDDNASGNGTASGAPSNRRKGDKEDADKAALAKKFPALARR